MANFEIFLSDRSGIEVDLPHADLEELSAEILGKRQHLLGTLACPDEDGVFRMILIDPNRIICIVALD